LRDEKVILATIGEGSYVIPVVVEEAVVSSNWILGTTKDLVVEVPNGAKGGRLPAGHL